MYSRPSSSTRRAPRPSRKKTGVPPTAPKARTGELTPPGISARDLSNSARLRSCIGSSSGLVEEGGEAAGGGRDVARVEDGGDDREHVRPGLDDPRRVLERDAADRRDGQARSALRRGEALEARAHRGGLGRRRKDAPDGNVV